MNNNVVKLLSSSNTDDQKIGWELCTEEDLEAVPVKPAEHILDHLCAYCVVKNKVYIYHGGAMYITGWATIKDAHRDFPDIPILKPKK